jgi:8-oxo-dGTP pyrophosphatase MutT (NUDIX family)
MYKVYFNNRLICIGSDNQPSFDGNSLKKISGAFKIREEWEKFLYDENCKGIWMQGDAKGIWNKFKSMFVRVKAAGGLVKNQAGEYLLIYRKKKWDLPKGKLEKKETLEMAAMREVEEECGISELTIIEPLTKSYHIYEDEGWYMIKHSNWFTMTTTYTDKPVPQTEEGIEKAIWVKPDQLKNYMEDMYPSIRDVLEEYLKK